MANNLNVSRNTVINAYHSLINDGLVESRGRSGYFVNARIRTVSLPPAAAAAPKAVVPKSEVALFEHVHPTTATAAYKVITRPEDWHKYKYPFVCNQMDTRHFPLAEWRKCAYQALNRSQTVELTSDKHYGDSDELITQIRNRILPRRGIYAHADEILITAGAQQALFLTAMIFGSQNRKVGLEHPCYPDARNIFGHFFGRQELIDVDRNGLVCDERLNDCDVVYVTPNQQYPTTARMSTKRRADLLEASRHHNFVIVEDDYDCETDFNPIRVPALKGAEGGERVIYVGSLSKSLGPGLRLGYVVGSTDFIREARALRGMMIRHPPSFVQLTLAKFIRLGHHDALISRLQSIFERRWYAASKNLKMRFPEASIIGDFGGSNFFLTFPDGVNLKGFSSYAMKHNMVIEDISPCFRTHNLSTNKMRLGFSAMRTPHIPPGIELLRELLTKYGG